MICDLNLRAAVFLQTLTLFRTRTRVSQLHTPSKIGFLVLALLFLLIPAKLATRDVNLLRRANENWILEMNSLCFVVHCVPVFERGVRVLIFENVRVVLL